MAKTSKAKRLDSLGRHIGISIEEYSKKHTTSHVAVLRSLELLRHLITEDFIDKFPQDMWMLHKE